MNSNIKIHTSTNLLPNVKFPLYFTKAYLEAQGHQHLISCETSTFIIHLSQQEEQAISMPKSPFGSLLVASENISPTEIKEDFNEVLVELKGRGIKHLIINHPSEIYPHFDSSWFEENGLEMKYHEINQHIELKDGWEKSIHQMQQRKLRSLAKEGFEFRKIPEGEVEMVHKFIAACRLAQGLVINIPLETLQTLVNNTGGYDFFGVFREDKISAACIVARVSDEIAYYYLPGTSPMFRSQSPMVLLIKGMVEYYTNQGFKYLDLGISSIQGKPQETLRIFKERMGAIETRKTTWEIPLSTHSIGS